MQRDHPQMKWLTGTFACWYRAAALFAAARGIGDKEARALEHQSRYVTIAGRGHRANKEESFCSPVLLIIGGPATLRKGLICAAAAQT
jgi:hypothetical protein